MFISYSHSDFDAARRIAKWMSDAGARPIWDQQLQPGTRFRQELLTFIGNAHIFLPLLTELSTKRPWVLQEMGYAAALNIPIVPVSAGPLPEGLLGDIQALQIAPDWSDLEPRLASVDWLGLKETQVREPNTVLATLVRSSLDRVKLLVAYGKRVQALGDPGMLRQRAGLSTFSIPDVSVMHQIWVDFDGPDVRTPEHHEQQRYERRIFEIQARTSGCRLMINTNFPYDDRKSKRTRLGILRSFLADPANDEKIQAIPHQRKYRGNLTLCGDWWLAESLLPRAGDQRETTFTWHPGTVQRFCEKFDDEFLHLCDQQNVSPDGSRLRTLEEIDREIARCE